MEDTEKRSIISTGVSGSEPGNADPSTATNVAVVEALAALGGTDPVTIATEAASHA